VTKPKHPLDKLMDKAETVMETVPEGYRALFVLVDANGKAHMTHSCCDVCGMKMGMAAYERYSADCAPPGPSFDIEGMLAVMERAGKTQH
jgi:hypothetical protein